MPCLVSDFSSATMKFENVETQEMLVGTVVYNKDQARVILAGNSARGTMTLNCSLSGGQLTGTWDSKGADGKSTKGTIQAAKTRS